MIETLDQGIFWWFLGTPRQVANFSDATGPRSKWRRSQSVVSGVRIVETPDEQRLDQKELSAAFPEKNVQINVNPGLMSTPNGCLIGGYPDSVAMQITIWGNHHN